MNHDSRTTVDSADACIPEVMIESPETPLRFCLNPMAPGRDSCAEVIISGNATNGVVLQFNYTVEGVWSYAGMKSVDTAADDLPLQIDVTNDPEGNLLRVSVHPSPGNDSALLLSVLRLRNDRPDTSDSTPPSRLSVRRMVYSCRRIEYKVVIEERIFTYPRNFRRDPVLNYPELSMFHCGGSVRMPTARSLENRAQQFCYWHCQQLALLTFEDPEEIARKEAAINRMGLKKPKEKKRPEKERRPPPVRFKPLY